MFDTQRKLGRIMVEVAKEMRGGEMDALEKSLIRGRWTLGVATDGTDEHAVLRCVGAHLTKGRRSLFAAFLAELERRRTTNLRLREFSSVDSPAQVDELSVVIKSREG